MAASRVRSRAVACQQELCRIIMVEIPVSNNPLMRDIDSMVSDYGLLQRVGEWIVSRDLVAGKEARPPTSDVGCGS